MFMRERYGTVHTVRPDGDMGTEPRDCVLGTVTLLEIADFLSSWKQRHSANLSSFPSTLK